MKKQTFKIIITLEILAQKIDVLLVFFKKMITMNLVLSLFFNTSQSLAARSDGFLSSSSKASPSSVVKFNNLIRSIGSANSILQTNHNLTGDNGASRTLLQFQLNKDSTDSNRETTVDNWPSVPRMWSEFSKGGNKEYIVEFKPKIPVIGIGAAYVLVVRKTSKMTLFVVASKKENGILPTKQVDEDMKRVSYDKLFDKNEKHPGELFAKSIKTSPTVGLCVLESSVYIENKFGALFDPSFPLVVQELDTSFSVSSISYSSKFFEIDPEISIREYEDTICGNYFRNAAEPVVSDEFDHILEYRLNDLKEEIKDKFIISKVTVKKGKKSDLFGASCVPTKDIFEGHGDASCMEWYNSLNSRVQNLTVPRCVPIEGNPDKFQCTLKAKKNTACPIYKENDVLVEIPTTKNAVRKTPGYYEFPCDQTGYHPLTCKPESTFFGGVRGVCK